MNADRDVVQWLGEVGQPPGLTIADQSKEDHWPRKRVYKVTATVIWTSASHSDLSKGYALKESCINLAQRIPIRVSCETPGLCKISFVLGCKMLTCALELQETE